jgi:hypothetical protein
MKNAVRRFPSMLIAFAVVVVSAQVADAQSVTRIEVRLKTGDVDGAGTDCRVYLGLGGREFNLDIRDTDDRKRNSNDLYALGEVGNVYISGDNDPRAPLALTVANAFNYPEGKPDVTFRCRVFSF